MMGTHQSMLSETGFNPRHHDLSISPACFYFKYLILTANGLRALRDGPLLAQQ
jgi:hypothetical protein